jgi:hypothetical protein
MPSHPARADDAAIPPEIDTMTWACGSSPWQTASPGKADFLRL